MSICLSVDMICLYAYLCGLSMCLSVHPPVHLSICLSFRRSVNPCIFQYINATLWAILTSETDRVSTVDCANTLITVCSNKLQPYRSLHIEPSGSPHTLTPFDMELWAQDTRKLNTSTSTPHTGPQGLRNERESWTEPPEVREEVLVSLRSHVTAMWSLSFRKHCLLPLSLLCSNGVFTHHSLVQRYVCACTTNPSLLIFQ